MAFVNSKHEQAVREWFDKARESEKIEVYCDLNGLDKFTECLEKELDLMIDEIAYALLEGNEDEAKDIFISCHKYARQEFLDDMSVEDFEEYLLDSFDQSDNDE